MLGKLLPVVAMAVGFVLPMYVWAKFVTIRAIYAPGNTFAAGLITAMVTSFVCAYGFYFLVAVLMQH